MTETKQLRNIYGIPCETLKELLGECKRCGPPNKHHGAFIQKCIQRVRRFDCIARLGFHIPIRKTVAAMAKFACQGGYAVLLSVGSGVGTVEKLIQLYATQNKLPLTVIATDPWLTHETSNANALIETHAVDGVSAVKKYLPKCLLVSWPVYDSPIASNVLKEFMKTDGEYVIYIGEGRGGCTADDEFHDLLDEHWDLRDTLLDARCWWGIYDAPHLYSRNTSYVEAKLEQKGAKGGKRGSKRVKRGKGSKRGKRGKRGK
jgi:hypothetical protein